MRQIIIDKSIERGQLIYKFSWKLLGDYSFSFLGGILLPTIVFIWSLINPYDFRNAPGDEYILCIIIWTLINYYYSIQLVEVRVKNAAENIERIKGIAQREYPSVRFTSGTPLVIRGHKSEGWSRRGKVINILIGGDYLYINILSTFRGGQFDVLFCGLINYLRSKSLAKEIQTANL